MFYLKKIPVLFTECTEMNWNVIYENELCASIFLNNMGWYLGVIGNIHNDECIIYIFTGKVKNSTTSIFNKSLYCCCYK